MKKKLEIKDVADYFVYKRPVCVCVCVCVWGGGSLAEC